jgi:hypothetical protein
MALVRVFVSCKDMPMTRHENVDALFEAAMRHGETTEIPGADLRTQ